MQEHGRFGHSEIPLLSSLGQVLGCILRHPEMSTKQISEDIGLTERTVWNKIRVLEAAALIKSERRGHRNYYSVDNDSVRELFELQIAPFLAIPEA